MKTERDVKAKVKKLLDAWSWFWWMPPANGYGKSGISDFNAIKSGVFLAVETKFGTNPPTPLQIGYLNSVRQEDGFGFVVNDRNIGTFEAFLAAFDRATRAEAAGETVDPEDGAMMLNAIRDLTLPL